MAEGNNEIRISLTLDGKDYVASITQADGTTKKFVITNRQLKKLLEETAKPVKNLTGSVNDLRARLASAQKTFNALSPSAKNYGTALKRVSVLQQHLSNVTAKSTASMGKFGAASGQTGFAILNMNRVVSDAPFGMIAISNNIEPLVQSFITLRNTAGGTKAAFAELKSSLIGPLGFMTAVSLITAAVTAWTLYGDKIKSFFGLIDEGAEDAKKRVKALGDELNRVLEIGDPFSTDKFKINKEDIGNTIDALDKIIKKLEETKDAQQGALSFDRFIQQNASNLSAVNELIKINNKESIKSREKKIDLTKADIEYNKKLLGWFKDQKVELEGKVKLHDMLIKLGLTQNNVADSTINKLRDQIKSLKKLRDETKNLTQKEANEYNKKIDEAQEKLSKLIGKVTVIYSVGSIGYLKDEIKKLNDQLEKTPDEDTRIKIQAKIDIKTSELDKIQSKLQKVIPDKIDWSKSAEESFDDLQKLIDLEDEAHIKKMKQIEYEHDAIKSYDDEERRDKDALIRKEDQLHRTRMRAYGDLANAIASISDKSDKMLNFLIKSIQAAIKIMDTMRSVNEGKTDKGSGFLSVISSVISIIPSLLAEGGNAVAGSPYIVGEAGPELFVPNNSGYVVSNNKLQQIGKTARENASYLAFNGGSRAATVNHKIDIKLRGSLKANKKDFVFDFNKANKKISKNLSVGSVNVYNT